MKDFFTKPWVIVGAWFATAAAIMLAPALAGLVLFPPDSDIIAQYYPLFSFYSEALHAGESFLWLPHIYSGFPVYLSQVAGFVDPVNVAIFSIFSGIDGMHVRLALDFLLAFVCSYIAARTLGVSRTASALVGPLYLVAHHWRFLSNPITANTLFLMPLLLYCITRALSAERGVWRFVVLGGVGVGWALLSGYTQVIVYAVMFGGLYALGYFFLIEARRTLKRFVRVVYLYAAMVALGLLLGLPQILPALEFVPLTVRSEGIDYALTTLKVIEPGDLLLSVVPDYFYVPYVTAGRKPLFVGALWFFLAVSVLVVSFVALARRRAMRLDVPRRYALILSVLFVFALIAAFKWSPLFWLLHQLPVFEYFRFPFRFMFLGTFFLALLGAFGFDMIGQLVHERLVRWWAYFAATLSALFVFTLAAAHLFGGQLVALGNWLLAAVGPARLGLGKDPSHYQEALQRGIDAYRELLSFGDWIILVPLMLLLASGAAFVAVVRGKLSVEVFKKIAAMLAALTFVVVFVAGWRWSAPPEVIGAGGNVLSGYINEEDKALYRFYSFVPYHSASQYIPPQYKLSLEEERAMTGITVAGAAYDTHLYTGISSIDGYDQFMPAALLRSLEDLGGELAAGGVSSYGTRTFDERRQSLLNNLQLFGMMGGKYIISGMPLVHPSLKLLGEPKVTSYQIPLYVYEYAHPWPIYFLAAERCSACTPVSDVLEVRAAGNGRYRFATDSNEPRSLILLQTNLPGWKAAVDGTEAPIEKVNEQYIGVVVPAGKHEIVLEYRGMLGELTFLRALGIVKPL